MPNLNPNQRIYDVLKDIERGVYRLPNIQRGFEWDEDRICKLLDSVLHEYPIGAIMVWLPPETLDKDIQTRSFVKDFDTTQDYVSQAAHPRQQESYLVLDGQQRLQSLYLAFFGTYNNRRIYFQIDHAPSPEADEDGPFELLTPAEANARPELVHPVDLIRLDYRTKSDFAEQRSAALCDSGEDRIHRAEQLAGKRSTIMQNLDLFIESFNMRPALLIQEIASRHNYDHVLEIFQRVNGGGMALSKSDLMFCTLKLKIQDMEERFTEALCTINQAGRFTFTRDFLIKASLVLFEQGAKYEVGKLKSDKFIAKLREGFDDLYHCLRQLVAWLETAARINNSRFLRSDNALIPILDYMYHSGKHDRPEGADSRYLLQYLYMAFLMRLFSRGGDRTLDQLHTRIVQALQTSPGVFPITVVRDYICKRMNVKWELAERNFADDPELMLNIVDNGALQLNPQQHGDQRLERDHIFPRKLLADRGLGDLADHIGNYRLVVMPINRRKKAAMPTRTTDFYGRHNETLEPLYQAAIGNLTRETFQSFRYERAASIVTAVNKFLDLDETNSVEEGGEPVAMPISALATPQTVAECEANRPGPADAGPPVPGPNGGQKATVIEADEPGLDIRGLRTKYQIDGAVRLLVDHFGSRQRNQAVSPVDTLERALDAAGTPLGRNAIINALKELGAVGVGRFIPGRKGYPTRFEWSLKSLQVRGLASGEQHSEQA